MNKVIIKSISFLFFIVIVVFCFYIQEIKAEVIIKNEMITQNYQHENQCSELRKEIKEKKAELKKLEHNIAREFFYTGLNMGALHKRQVKQMILKWQGVCQ